MKATGLNILYHIKAIKLVRHDHYEQPILDIGSLDNLNGRRWNGI
jgi:hypothetical protein